MNINMMKAFFFISSVFATTKMQLDLQSSSARFAIMETDMRIDPMLKTLIKYWIDSVAVAMENEIPDHLQLSALQTTGKTLQLKVIFQQMQGESNSTTTDPPIQVRGKNKVAKSEKYINYGCYCTPSATNDENWVGTGEPVDDIDRLCRDLFNAYNCLKNDFSAECSAKSTYDWKIDNSGQPKCGNNAGTCGGDVCRLDMSFASSLMDLDNSWNAEFHKQNGFNRKKQCGTAGARSSLESTEENKSKDNTDSNTSNESKNTCCGKGLGRHLYRPDRLECCKNGSTRPLGTC